MGGSSPVLKLSVVVLFIASVSLLPIICSASGASDTSSPGDVAAAPPHNGNHNHHRRRHRPHARPGSELHNGEETTPDATASSSSSSVLVGYSDSYITKKAAEDLQEKLRQLHHRVTDEEYNALLQQFVSKPKSDPSHPIFDKMYYDYLPSETPGSKKEEENGDKDGGEQDAIDLTSFVKNKRKRPFKKAHSTFVLAQGDRIELPEENHHHKHHQGHQGERRTKRSLGHGIEKRQAGVWTNQYQERRTFPVVDRDYEDHQSVATSHARQWNVAQYRQPNPFVSPWHRFYPQYTLQRPHNYYLPVAPPPEYQFIVRPQQPWMRFPIPGVVYNPSFPPMNPPVIGPVFHPDSNSITGTDKDEENNNQNPSIPNRFGGDEDDEEEDRFIFDVEERTPPSPPPPPAAAAASRPVRPVTQPPRPATRRPPPPLIRDSDHADDTQATINSIFANNRPTFNNNRPNVQAQSQFRTTTRRPPPPLIRDSDNESPQSSNQFGK